MNYPGQSPSGITFPQDDGLRVGRQVRGQARLPVQPGSPRPRDSLTPAFSGRKGAETSAPKPREGKGPRRGASDRPLRARQVPPGCLRGAVSLSPPRAPWARAPEELVLAPSLSGTASPSKCGPARPGAHLTSPAAARGSIGPKFRPHTASSGSCRKQLERGTGSLAAPHAHTHFLASRPSGGPPGAPVCDAGLRARTQGAVVSHLPLILYRPSGLRGLQSPQNGSVHSRRDVTASLQRRTGRGTCRLRSVPATMEARTVTADFHRSSQRRGSRSFTSPGRELQNLPLHCMPSRCCLPNHEELNEDSGSGN
ncbi:translation initiation factor IF-2-like [Myotis myotis]|uniref:translation initiation factor IF-2-like n=1 Tax=Myotis myotis TaxID=51298 RepID=UPI001747E111|nr:translation initiation factor IF-2-like [Myotis myotis]